MTLQQDTIQWIHTFKANGRKTDLKRMAWLLEQVGNPQDKFPAIHVVGTNGKGSVTAYLQHIFSQSGYKVGTFTSPFILSFHDRICINGQAISDQDLLAIAERLKPLLERLSQETSWDRPTEFELVTLIMFYYFAFYNPVDLAIIEAGIGGKGDATNVFQALALICPSISFDHQERLGYSLKAIAKQKAGAIKTQQKVIIGKLDKEAQDVFLKTSLDTQSSLFQLGKDFHLIDYQEYFDFTYQDITLKELKLLLIGHHQRENACLAIMTALQLRETFPNLSLASIQEGVQSTTWPGRSELIKPNILLDGAHNPDAILKLRQLLMDHFSDRSIRILFAGLKRKPLRELLQLLSDYPITVTSFDFFEACPLEDYSQAYAKTEDYRKWLLKTTTSSDLIVVTGSLYFISEVRRFCLDMLNTKKP
ncbi:bifunctional folylpolyglutamate synthase/dihydrofolate synthase [Streptococcus ictaluri]|uniref:tetrahydrofolate synthase n=1 Tax=Streptococcus ictaluri 707-05 TaxID=764299 RepID=G5K3T8_9STRE|nr:folylpolyglutamate synthase/dihydrofolate synthase family protein [Streptococcus ictaluri]EHI69806.1 bifunctional protein FolC [Streptococcus ictaluri 707-05]